MKKKILIVISILVGCLLILLAVLHFGPQPMWRIISNRYLNNDHIRFLGYRISAHAVASHPENLEYINAKTFSDGLVFQTDKDLNGGAAKGESPLPYPPIEVHCVVAHNMEQTKFLLIALHSDGKNSAWVVHDLPMNGKMFRNLINRIGCDLTRW